MDAGVAARRALIRLAAGGALLVAAAVVWAIEPASPKTVLVASAIAAAGYLGGISALAAPEWSRAAGAIAVVVAVGARAPLVAAPPVLEDDVHRYLWDGAVVVAGESPYAFAPQEIMDARRGLGAGDPRARRLAKLSADPSIDPAFRRINYPSVPTIYPPVAQGAFAIVAAIAPGSVAAWKVAIVIFDAATAALIAAILGALGRPRRWILVYAWSPLVILSFAGSAHMDLLPVAISTGALFAAIRGRAVVSGSLLGLAIAAKLYPAIFWLPLRRRLGWRGTIAAAAVAIAAWTPFLSEGRLFEGFAAYASLWTANGAGFAVVALALPELAARAVSGAAIVALAVWFSRRDDLVDAAQGTLASLVLLSPAVNPWYVAWLVPFAALTRSAPLVALSLGLLAYPAIFLDGKPPAWLAPVEYAPALIVLVALRLRDARARARAIAAGQRTSA